jgi:hypothetical protein
MVADNFISELFEYPSGAFKEHINNKQNFRIIFSGRFGIGKTYFLKHFFKEEVQESQELFRKKKYNTYHIFPINYSVASNEDIFSYIKYDIIISMLLQGVKTEDFDNSYLTALPFFIKDNLNKVFASLVRMIPKVGKDLDEVLEKVIKLKDHFLKYYEEHNPNEGDFFIRYLNNLELNEGGIYEKNLFTKLIEKTLERIKNVNGIENVLIVDDLDRIDPEHIFRLLNVFGAHLDNKEEIVNKFGFDKIVFVCDIRNIKNIFHAKYGSDVDFNGYIDKFYSKEIFHFDNKKIINQMAFQTLKALRFKDVDVQENHFLRLDARSRESFVVDILQILLLNGLITLRNLLSIDESINLVRANFSFPGNLFLYAKDYPELVHYESLKNIVRGTDTLKQLFNKIPLESYTAINIDSISRKILVFLTYNKHCFQKIDEQFRFNHNNKLFKISLKRENNYQFASYTTYVDLIEIKESVIIPLHNNYDFNKSEFRSLMNEFFDLMDRVN